MAFHQFRVGQVVDFNPAGKTGVPASTRVYKILRLLPAEGREPHYRIKTITEAYERIARESELSQPPPPSESDIKANLKIAGGGHV